MGGRVGLSRSLLVAITSHGVTVPAVGSSRPLDLHLGELELIRRLRGEPEAIAAMVDDVAAATHTPRERLWSTVDHLAAIGRLHGYEGRGDTSSTDSAEWPAEASPPPARPAVRTRAADVADDRLWALAVPVALVPDAEGFAFVDPDGALIARCSSVEVLALAQFGWQITLAEAAVGQRRVLGEHALDDDAVTSLVARLHDTGLMMSFTGEEDVAASAQGRSQQLAKQEMRRLRVLVEISEQQAAERATRRRGLVAAGTAAKPFVVPYYKVRGFAPLALGLIIATAQQHDHGRLTGRYEFEPNWVAGRSTVRALLKEAPAVVLFSSYVWSHAHNLEIAASVKQRSPDSVTIHGGPDVPSREGEDTAYLRAHPYVDIIVRGEGEYTTAEILDVIDGRLSGRAGSLPDLDGVAGITYRDGERLVRTADRERIADLDALPSPYLTGVFDAFATSTLTAFVAESNRGCPYGCTFCDWGSATRSRIRKFSMERVFEELAWAARSNMPRVIMTDANFGILPRDLEIAEEIARLKRDHGSPSEFSTNFAKNTTTNLKAIVQTLAGAGVIADGLLSLQTTDDRTLRSINRSNIKLTEYEELARTFREAGLPLYVDLMMGLPGATPASFRRDLQYVIDSEVTAKVFQTELLVNSPMNEPAYLAEHRIAAEPVPGAGSKSGRALLVSTSSYTRAEFDEMNQLRTTFITGENFASLRHVARFVRHETGTLESEFYAEFDRIVRRDPDTYPFLSWATETLPELLIPPASWALYYGDLERYLADVHGLAPSSTTRTVLRAQRALMPARLRSFPEVLHLEHDFAAWASAILAAKDAGTRWCERVPRLVTFGTATFTVDDPTDVCSLGLGSRIESDLNGSWELESSVGRVALQRHTNLG